MGEKKGVIPLQRHTVGNEVEGEDDPLAETLADNLEAILRGTQCSLSLEVEGLSLIVTGNTVAEAKELFNEVLSASPRLKSFLKGKGE